ncbi:MAG: hypothetical protein Q9217_003102 [Psora testacea]
MLPLRASARWTSYLHKSPLRTARSTAYRHPVRKVQKRKYATEGGDGGAHGAHKSGSDLPCEGHGHGGHEEHAEESNASVKSEGEGPEEVTSEDQGNGEQEMEVQSGEGDGSSEGENSSDSESENGQDTPDTSDNEGVDDGPQEKERGANVEGMRFKGAASATKEDDQNDTRMRIPDAKGGYKKRINSHYGRRQGVAQDEEQDPENEDLAAGSKPPGDFDKQSGKQEGLSNTDTKHSTDIANDPEKSTKSNGMPETAKSKGTVDPRV